jgi:hypothetical protein
MKREKWKRDIGKGNRCPKCSELMERFEHTPGWQPRPGKAWYAYWDLCPRCRRLQHYPEAWRPATPVDEEGSRSCNDDIVIQVLNEMDVEEHGSKPPWE